MRKISFLIIAAIAMTTVNAQNSIDGLRYSSEATTGTARFNALSGAFGALGGDLSAISINPAGSAVFLNSSGTVSIGANDKESNASYFNTDTKSIDTDFTINQAGAVFVFKNPSEGSKLKKFTFGFNYQQTKNFDNELFIKGTGNNSIGDFFRNQAQGIPLELLQLQSGESISDLYSYLGETQGVSAQNAFLGYQGFIIDPIDPDDPSNSEYTSNIAGNRNFNHDYILLSEGSNNKFTANFSAQITDQFYFGVNLNSHLIDYNQSSTLFESNNNDGSTVNLVGFENNLSVQGSGFSAQFGGIMKVQNNLRLGLSLETPTWYEITEETSQYLEVQRVANGQSVIETVNPRIINVYETYYLKTPGKVTASAAYIFGKQALISLDYSYKDYGSIEFDSLDGYDSYFNTVNNTIESSLKGASSIRVGGEYRINQLSLRGGLRYEGSPYNNEETIGDLSGFSLGAGYNLGNYTLDLSYARAEQERNQEMYGLADTAAVETTFSNVIFSVGFKF
ncbi:OmpP1/FadL family transporter [Ulvibacter litoralis]|uniref:Outer membrane protein transport protein (OMPP1/FadL/TodX) n=1 Tax=Ulvibacter litoralis TaxID=227084 RepID=A0A1G7IZB2_9FLAO|nr:transporter [Ulvibacter litoralis]GHC60279.1 transporter [Ulvibacter litoralis]SDF17965.1 hypothetical protein SAMN05421855_1082 [Ulvibacter litoralis]